MPYLIFSKNCPDEVGGYLYRIAENELTLNNMNITLSDYKITEVSEENFNLIKFGLQVPIKFVNNSLTYKTLQPTFLKDDLEKYIICFRKNINAFLYNNKNHLLHDIWQNYDNQLEDLHKKIYLENLEIITFPLNTSLEKYFFDSGLPSLSTLQVP